MAHDLTGGFAPECSSLTHQSCTSSPRGKYIGVLVPAGVTGFSASGLKTASPMQAQYNTISTRITIPIAKTSTHEPLELRSVIFLVGSVKILLHTACASAFGDAKEAKKSEKA